MRQVALLRGINLGSSRRIAMPELRARLGDAGYEDVRTYVQSGNVVLDSALQPGELAPKLADELEQWFGMSVPVLVRTAEELAAVVKGNPLADVADNPKYFVVVFMDRAPDAAALKRVAGEAADGEQLVRRGRELYAWHPQGQARSKLSLALSNAKLGVLTTARNWRTVTTLEEMCRN